MLVLDIIFFIGATMNEEIEQLRKRIAELEPYEAAVITLAADMDRDGAALLSDIKRDRFALAKRFRAVLKAKLQAQQAANA